jgi:predicted anti-sigma-YlaC factor YlaD
MSRLIRIWRLLNLPCAGVTRLASESLDRDLGRLERFAHQSHILYCRACRRYSCQINLVRRAMRQLATRLATDQPLPGPGLPQDARERIRRALKEN